MTTCNITSFVTVRSWSLFIGMIIISSINCADADRDLPDISACEDAFNHNRNVDLTSNAPIPYMKTCGLNFRSSRYLMDVFYRDMSVDQQYVDTIYDELEITDQILTKANIPYFVVSGTLLGAIRNGGLIPNDDDADIGVEEKYEPEIRKLFDEFDSRGYELKDYEMLGYKVHKKKANSNGLDIFLIKPRSIAGKDVLAFAKDQAFSNWPNETFDLDATKTLERIPFGHILASTIPLAKGIDYLSRAYGNDWYTVTVKFFDHVHGKPGRGKKEKLLPTEYYYLRHSKH